MVFPQERDDVTKNVALAFSLTVDFFAFQLVYLKIYTRDDKAATTTKIDIPSSLVH